LRMSDIFETGMPGEKTGGIPALTSANFDEWMDLVKTVLRSKKLWQYATGDTRMTRENAADFESEDAKAAAYLKLVAGKEQRVYLLGLDTSKEVLDKLKSLHQTPQDERISTLYCQFHGFKALASIDLSANRLTQLRLKIGAASQKEMPSETMMKTVLLQSLPDEYQATVLALEAAGLSHVSFDDLVQRLKKVETRLRDRKETDYENLARAAGQRHEGAKKAQSNRQLQSGQPQRGQKDKANKECFHCGKKGHFKRDCWVLNGKPAQQQQQQQQSQGATEHVAAAWGARYRAAFTYQKAVGQPQRQEWVLDSGCTRHMTYDRSHFVDFRRESGKVTLANGKTLRVRGKGTVNVPIQGKMIPIADVIYVPDIGFNLLSIAQLTARGITCEFVGDEAILSRGGEVVATSTRKDMTYALVARAPKHAMPSELWHRRLGHPGERKTKLIAEGVLKGAPKALKFLTNCEACHTTKSTQAISRVPAEKATEPLKRIHIDFWGPYHEDTIDGQRHMLTITDDFTRKSWIYLVKDRTEVYTAFRQWQASTELESGHRLKAIRIDNAKELLKLGGELERTGVRVERTAAYTPSQNGVAERLNRTLITKARALLVAAELPERLWGEAVHAANYLRNLTPQEDRMSPEQRWTGQKPRIGHLRVFGCIVYTHIPAQKRQKLQRTAWKGIFVGYALTERQYRVLDPKTMAVKLYSSITFDENQKGGQLLPQEQRRTPTPPAATATSECDDDDDMLSNIDVGPREVLGDTDRGTEQPTAEAYSDTESQPTEEEQGTDGDDSALDSRPTRSHRLPQRYRDTAAIARRVDCENAIETTAPRTFAEATQGKQARHWKTAIQEHLQSLEANHTWDVVDRPDDTNCIDTKWVFKVKTLPNKQLDKYKARLCAKGFTQQHGIDYFDTFAPVVRMESLRILLALAATEDLEVHQMDVVSAYLLGELEEDAYLKAPEGLDIPRGKVLKLRKGMPGLKQSGRIWNRKITAFFEEFGMRAIPADHSVFTNQDRTIIVALWVDDLMILARTVREMQPLKKALSETFEMKDLGEVKHLLGMQITRNRARRTIAIYQQHYVEELVREHSTEKTADVPVAGYEYLTRARPEEPLTDERAYQTLIGKLNWLTRATRPDIAFATQKLSQHAHNPTERHMTGAQHVLRYLAKTASLRVEYSAGTGENIAGYADADYAADESRKSTMGYVYTFAGGPITWSSKLQRSVSTSTTEAEYHALAHAGKEAVWIRNMLEQLHRFEHVNQPTTMHGDNQGALALVQNPEFHARTKHIDVSAHYVRELAEDQKISLQYIHTDEMLADMLTKPLKRVKHTKNIEQIGLRAP
jgi:hypothetical protein